MTLAMASKGKHLQSALPSRSLGEVQREGDEREREEGEEGEEEEKSRVKRRREREREIRVKRRK